AQSFELGATQEVYKGKIGETVRVPLKLTNRTGEPLSLIIKKVSSNLGSTQKDMLCPDNDCFTTPSDGLVVRLGPEQSLETVAVALEAGLASGISSVKYIIYNRSSPGEAVELDLNFSVKEWSAIQDILTHPGIVLHDVYPNPVTDHAFVKYDLINPQLEAKIVIHNILGNTIDEYLLPEGESVVKIRTDALSAGIYFYTLYLDNEGIMTRKLIVRK